MGAIFQFPFRTVAEISVPALVKNLVTLRAMSQRDVVPVLKANAYGHGMVPVARALVHRGSCQLLAVATLEEALDLRAEFSESTQIVVLSGFFPHQTSAYVKHRIIPMVHSMYQLKSLQGLEQLPEIHLKIDTGMHRLGIPLDEVSDARNLLTKMKIKLAGLATHLAESESLTSHFVDQQIAHFDEVAKELRGDRLLATDAKLHVANTGGILRNKLGPTVAVRSGIGIYGVSPNPRIGTSDMLTPALQWKTRVLSIKTVAKGETVGYGRTYRAKKKEKIALLPIGYADGYPRSLSNKGEVVIAGKRAPLRGRVSMDLIAVDITSISGIREGSEAVLIGKMGRSVVSAWDLATWAHTIPYEIFCGLSPRVPRVYLE